MQYKNSIGATNAPPTRCVVMESELTPRGMLGAKTATTHPTPLATSSQQLLLYGSVRVWLVRNTYRTRSHGTTHSAAGMYTEYTSTEKLPTLKPSNIPPIKKSHATGRSVNYYIIFLRR